MDVRVVPCLVNSEIPITQANGEFLRVEVNSLMAPGKENRSICGIAIQTRTCQGLIPMDFAASSSEESMESRAPLKTSAKFAPVTRPSVAFMVTKGDSLKPRRGMPK